MMVGLRGFLSRSWTAKIDMKVIASDQHQVFGHLTGTAVLDDGTELKMRDVIAAIEVVHNRY